MTSPRQPAEPSSTAELWARVRYLEKRLATLEGSAEALPPPEPEDLYRAFLEHIDHAFCVTQVVFGAPGDPIDLRVLEANPAFERLTGISAVAGRRLREIAPHVEERWYHTMVRIATTGRPERFTARSMRVRGRWYDVYALPVGPPDEHDVAVLISDITSRRRAEQQLRRNEARQAFLLALSDAMRGETDAGEICLIALRMLGEHLDAERVYFAEVDESARRIQVEWEFVRDSGASLAGEYPLDAFTWVLRASRRGQPIVFDDIRGSSLIPDDQRGMVEELGVRAGVIIPLVKEGRLLAALGLAERVPRTWSPYQVELAHEAAERLWETVERSLIEGRLRKTEERARLALDASGMGSFLWYPGQDLGEPDERARELFGLRADSASTLGEALMSVIHPDDRERVVGLVHAALDPASDGAAVTELRVVHPDGSVRWLSVRAQTAFTGDPPHPAYVAGVAMDVTEQRLREEELRDARQAAQRANDAKSEFVATISHELRTPLNAVVGYASLLLAGVPEPLGERARHHVLRLDHAARHLKSLIEGVLAFSRLEAGHELVRTEERALRDIVDELEAVVEPLAREKSLELRIAYDGEPQLIHTDVSKLRQILLNLLGNAAKFTESGTIGLRVRPRGNDVDFEVWDTGPGIDVELRDVLFEPFVQGGGGTQRQAGSGLGLTISRRFARLLGGDLTLESAPDGGSLFRLRLPVRGDRHGGVPGKPGPEGPGEAGPGEAGSGDDGSGRSDRPEPPREGRRRGWANYHRSSAVGP